jgi:hypothetical protein
LGSACPGLVNLDVMFLVVCSVCISNSRHPRAVIDATEPILAPETLAPAAKRDARDEKGEASAAETVRPRASGSFVEGERASMTGRGSRIEDR